MTTLSANLVGPSLSVRRAEQLRLCVVEARPVVLLIYAVRLVVAFALVHVGIRPFQLWRLPVALLTWLLAVASIYLLDGVMDVVEDRLNGSSRPIARGALPRPFALTVSGLWAGLSMAGALVLGSPYTYLVPAMLLMGYAYSGPLPRLKRWSSAAGATVLVAGLLTFVAGGGVSGSLPGSLTLVVFAIAMSSWMGLVGALAKDFSDVPGDALVGRRTSAVVRGVRRTAWLLTFNAFVVALGFLAGALLVNHLLLWPAAVVAFGAFAVAFGCYSRSARTKPRRPYRAFMVTQYLAHVIVLVVIALP
jgi:4-hydroxybenzoate polyprenyltransferase